MPFARRSFQVKKYLFPNGTLRDEKLVMTLRQNFFEYSLYFFITLNVVKETLQ